MTGFHLHAVVLVFLLNERLRDVYRADGEVSTSYRAAMISGIRAIASGVCARIVMLLANCLLKLPGLFTTKSVATKHRYGDRIGTGLAQLGTLQRSVSGFSEQIACANDIFSLGSGINSHAAA